MDSYPMVRTLLTELADYPEAYRRQINVLSFIQRRTNLSRSRVMSILAELRKGGYYGPSRGAGKDNPHASRPLLNPRGGGRDFPTLVNQTC